MLLYRRVGLLGLLVGCLGIWIALTGSAEAMSFRAVQLADGEFVIAATGQITEETPGEFKSFLQENEGARGLHAVVFLDSPGGRVMASMEFGTLLRQIGAAAVVGGVQATEEGRVIITNGQCFSACVYAFIGARKRVVPVSSQIGIHRMFAYQQEVDANNGTAYLRRRYDNGEVGQMLKRYTSAMGVSPALISEAEHISSDGLKILTRSEIRRYRLAASHL